MNGRSTEDSWFELKLHAVGLFPKGVNPYSVSLNFESCPECVVSFSMSGLDFGQPSNFCND